jgi:hypothetical protein
LNPAGLRARSLRLGESSKPMRCQQHLGGRLECSLNASNGAVLFCGISEFRFNISISGGSLLYQVGLARILKRSILHDAVQANLVHQRYFVVAQAAGVACFIATAQQKFKHRTGYTQPLFIQHRLQPAG